MELERFKRDFFDNFEGFIAKTIFYENNNKMDLNCPSLSDNPSNTIPTSTSFQILSSNSVFELSETFFDYTERNDEENEEKVTPEEALEMYLDDLNYRKEDMEQEALNFLKEIYESEEFNDRSNLKDVATQVNQKNLINFQKEIEELMKSEEPIDFPLTKLSQEKYRMEHIAEVKRKCRENRIILEKQKESVKRIKDGIFEAMAEMNRQKTRRRNAIRASEQLALQMNPNEKVSRFTVVSVKKVRKSQLLGKQRRLDDIIRKLVREEQIRREVKALKEKTYDYKVRKKEKIIYGMAIKGARIILKERPRKIVEDVAEDVHEEELVEEDDDKKKKGKKDKKDKGKKDKKGKDKKSKDKKSKDKKSKDKKSKDKKSKDKKSKKGKKDKKEIEEFVMPEIPIINEHYKIRNVVPEAMLNMIAVDQDFRDTLKQIEIERKYLYEKKSYDVDKKIVFYPNPIVFSEVKNGYYYTKSVSVINMDGFPKKIKVLNAEIFNGENYEHIEVEKFGIYLLISGLPFSFKIKIHSSQITHPVNGNITFLTWSTKTPFKELNINDPCGNETKNDSKFHPIIKESSLKVEILTPYDEIIVTPHEFDFGSIQFWKIKNNFLRKTLRIINHHEKLCQVYIHKVLDSFDYEKFLRYHAEAERELNEGEDENGEEGFGSDIFDDSGYFSFSEKSFFVDGRSEKEVFVDFKQPDYIGDYFDKFQVKIYQENEENYFHIVDFKTIILTAETIPYFINVVPETLDFEITSIDSTYQTQIKLFNSSKLPQRILIAFPTRLKSYLSCLTPEVIIPGHNCTEMSIKFYPDEKLTTEKDYQKYYDEETRILNFNISLKLVAKNSDDFPVIKVPVFAIVVPKMPLVLKPLYDDHITIVNDDMGDNVVSVDCGSVNDRENAFVKIGLTNYGLDMQHFGFLKCPKYVNISPNYGFGVIEPLQSKILKVYICLEKEDLANVSTTSKVLFFKLTITTIKQLGSVEKKFDLKAYKKTLNLMESVLNQSKKEDVLETEMNNSLIRLKNDEEFMMYLENIKYLQHAEDEEYRVEEENTITFEITQSAESNEISRHLTSLISIDKSLKRDSIYFVCELTENWSKLSHEWLILPNTPCGSYSMFNIGLTSTPPKPTKKGEKLIVGQFEIFCDNNLIQVEPRCGEIKPNETKQINLIAKPEIPQNIIEDKAKEIRKDEIMKSKIDEIIEKRKREKAAKEAAAKAKAEKESKKGSKKGSKKDSKKSAKKGKKGKAEETDVKEKKPPPEEIEEPLPEITVDESEIILTPFDFYPTEMILWRDFSPYVIHTTFTIKVTYSESQKSDEIFLKASCQVIMPDFNHNLNTQHIDFGPTVIGDSRRIILELRNIQHTPIKPTLEKLQTSQIFFTPNVVQLPLPPEHILTVPVSFKPKESTNVSISINLIISIIGAFE
nr:uncharacterized protein LOC111422307 [Onthophagus taurus]